MRLIHSDLKKKMELRKSFHICLTLLNYFATVWCF